MNVYEWMKWIYLMLFIITLTQEVQMKKQNEDKITKYS